MTVEDQIKQYEDDGLLEEYELADGTTTGAIDLVDMDRERESEEGTDAIDMVDEAEEPAFRDITQGRATRIDGQVYVLFDDGVVTDSSGLNVGDSDIETAVKDKLTITAEELAADSAERNASLAGEPLPSTLIEMKEYDTTLRGRGIVPVEDDFLAAGYTAADVETFGKLNDPGSLSESDIEELRSIYLSPDSSETDLLLGDVFSGVFGSELGTMLSGSLAQGTEMAGNLLSALGELDKRTINSIAVRS